MQVLRKIEELSKLSRSNFPLGGLRKEVHKEKNESFHLGYFSNHIKKMIEIAIQRTSGGEMEVKTNWIMFNKKVYSHCQQDSIQLAHRGPITSCTQWIRGCVITPAMSPADLFNLTVGAKFFPRLPDTILSLLNLISYVLLLPDIVLYSGRNTGCHQRCRGQ